jgi:hypothetical protein
VPLSEIRDVERRLVRSVRDDLRHTDESVDLLAEYHRTYGEGLGIPQCEREWFAECYENVVTTGLQQASTAPRGGHDSTELAGKLVAESPEHRSARAAMNRFIWDVLVHHVVAPEEAGIADIVENPPETFFARPTTGFYPHSPVCDRAIGLGKSVDGAIDDEAVRDLYRIELVYNNLKGLVVEYERYRNGFDLDTGEYFRTLGDRFEASERIERTLDEMAELNEGHQLFEYLVEQYY